jgi:hypothetical protein
VRQFVGWHYFIGCWLAGGVDCRKRFTCETGSRPWQPAAVDKVESTSMSGSCLNEQHAVGSCGAFGSGQVGGVISATGCSRQ